MNLYQMLLNYRQIATDATIYFQEVAHQLASNGNIQLAEHIASLLWSLQDVQQEIDSTLELLPKPEPPATTETDLSVHRWVDQGNFNDLLSPTE